ncbi:uncharacterized protein LOC142567798 isoform X3 [Dermacentor variabilis]|uniref:uncharacterized protein LOC142567798 isoform X3 n=1 Tax=Dermacentor variabilis TaxID=34621 RepID=UPI003F5B3467
MPTDTKNDARAKFQHLSGHEGPPLLTHALLPAVIMLLMPNVVVCTVCFVVSHSSSTTKALEFGFSKFWHESWASQGFAALETWAFIVAFTVYSGLSLLLIHGSTYHGPPTSSGYRPVYRKSGFTYYVITMTIAACVLIVVDAPCQVAYRCMPGLAAALALFAFAIPLLLYAKGRMSPSPGEHGTTGRLVLDFYWGMELYPRIGERLDIKQWTNCRFGMMMWQLLVLVGWKAQIEASGWNWCVASTALLQTIYIAKFFWWEDGYMQTIDITVDRADFSHVLTGAPLGSPPNTTGHARLSESRHVRGRCSTATFASVVTINRSQRNPQVIAGLRGEDVEDWLQNYDLASTSAGDASAS